METTIEPQRAQDEPPGVKQGALQNPNTGLIELGFKSIAAVAAVSYVSGYIIVSGHLAQYGVLNTDLLNPRYLSAGALWLFLFVIIAFAAFASVVTRVNRGKIVGMYRRRQTIGLILRILLFFCSICVVGGLIAFTVVFLLIGQRGAESSFLADALINNRDTTVLTVVWGVFTAAAACIFSAVYLLFLMLPSYSRGILSKWIIMWLVFSTCLISLFFFAGRIYPRLPSSIGGGRSIEIVIVVDEQGEKTIGQLIPLNATAKGLSVPVRLIGQTEAGFIVLRQASPDKDQAVFIAKELVKGIIYSSPTTSSGATAQPTSSPTATP